MLPEHIINIHGHLRVDQDIPARVRFWEQWNVRKFIALALPERYAVSGYHGNDGVRKWMREFPDVIVGMACMESRPANPHVAEDVDRFKDQGFTGLKFIDAAVPYNAEQLFPIFERAEALQMPILFHCGILAVTPDGRDRELGTDVNNMRPIYLDRVTRCFPELRIIGAHLGYPWPHEAALMVNTHKNIYFDLTGGGGNKEREYQLRRFFAPAPGANLTCPAEHPALACFEKLCFGTDNPEPDIWVPLSQRLLDYLDIPEPTRQKFWYKNAAHIFNWTEFQ